MTKGVSTEKETATLLYIRYKRGREEGRKEEGGKGEKARKSAKASVEGREGVRRRGNFHDVAFAYCAVTGRHDFQARVIVGQRLTETCSVSRIEFCKLVSVTKQKGRSPNDSATVHGSPLLFCFCFPCSLFFSFLFFKFLGERGKRGGDRGTKQGSECAWITRELWREGLKGSRWKALLHERRFLRNPVAGEISFGPTQASLSRPFVTWETRPTRFFSARLMDLFLSSSEFCTCLATFSFLNGYHCRGICFFFCSSSRRNFTFFNGSVWRISVELLFFVFVLCNQASLT